MQRIIRLSVVVDAAEQVGYNVTASLYCQGDRKPSDTQQYGPLDHVEMSELVEALTYRYRPGWAVENCVFDVGQLPSFIQESLW